MVRILSVSVSEEDKVMLDDMELSPSGLLKQKLGEVRQNSLNFKNRVLDLEQNIAKLQELSKQAYAFIERHGLSDEYQRFLNGAN